MQWVFYLLLSLDDDNIIATCNEEMASNYKGRPEPLSDGTPFYDCFKRNSVLLRLRLACLSGGCYCAACSSYRFRSASALAFASGATSFH
jgi:hypothetical protein